MRTYPKGFGGHREDPDKIKRTGWRDMGTLVVELTDQRLSWPERELIKQLGQKLYGPTKATNETEQP